MPLEAIAINDFNTPLMRETTFENELKNRIQSLYKDMGDKFDVSAEAIIQMFTNEFTQGNQLYVGMFNDKPICALGCFTDGDSIRLDYLAMHQQNQNRGIEPLFLRQVVRHLSSRLMGNAQKISTNDELIGQILQNPVNN